MFVMQVQSGAHPSVKDISAVRGVFSGQPLGLTGMDSGHMVRIFGVYFRVGLCL